MTIVLRQTPEINFKYFFVVLEIITDHKNSNKNLQHRPTKVQQQKHRSSSFDKPNQKGLLLGQSVCTHIENPRRYFTNRTKTLVGQSQVLLITTTKSQHENYRFCMESTSFTASPTHLTDSGIMKTFLDLLTNSLGSSVISIRPQRTAQVDKLW